MAVDDSAPELLSVLSPDDAIEAGRLLLVLLDGGHYTGEFTPGLVHGLAVFTLSAMMTNAALAGAEGTDAQAAVVREALTAGVSHATLRALAGDEAGDG
jgi:hypothetical protein